MISPSSTGGDFTPPRWLRNAHVQTLLANKPLRWPAAPTVDDTRYELPDGDVVRLVRSMAAASPPGPQPRVVVLHGLAGGYDSAYARDLFSGFAEAGLEGHLLHFRGCGGVMNRLPRGYHAGDTADLQHYVQYLRRQAPSVPVLAVGYSLGANVLLKYLGEQGERSGLDGAVAVSVPFLLDDACTSISSGFARLYHQVLLARLKHAMRQKFAGSAAGDAPFDLAVLDRVKSLKAFDHEVTAPMHGFHSADHYYGVASCRQYLGGIRTPTLVLHAADDPFQSPAGIPREQELAAAVELRLTRYGGHVGFVEPRADGRAGLRSWLRPQILRWLQAHATHATHATHAARAAQDEGGAGAEKAMTPGGNAAADATARIGGR